MPFAYSLFDDWHAPQSRVFATREEAIRRGNDAALKVNMGSFETSEVRCALVSDVDLRPHMMALAVRNEVRRACPFRDASFPSYASESFDALANDLSKVVQAWVNDHVAPPDGWVVIDGTSETHTVVTHVTSEGEASDKAE